MIEWFKQVWKKANMSPVEKYLAESTDLADLERRQRRLMLKGVM
jgi:hypothetical protein